MLVQVLFAFCGSIPSIMPENHLKILDIVGFTAIFPHPGGTLRQEMIHPLRNCHEETLESKR
jgi:hypothetical protein